MLLRGKADVRRASGTCSAGFISSLHAYCIRRSMMNWWNGVPGPTLELLPKRGDRRADGLGEIGDLKGLAEILFDIGHQLGDVANRSDRSWVRVARRECPASLRKRRGRPAIRLRAHRAVAMGHRGARIGDEIGDCRRHDIVDAAVDAAIRASSPYSPSRKAGGYEKATKPPLTWCAQTATSPLRG